MIQITVISKIPQRGKPKTEQRIKKEENHLNELLKQVLGRKEQQQPDLTTV